MQGTARDILSTEFAAVDPERSIRDAEQALLQSHDDELYVVGLDGRLLGVIPDYALLKHRLTPDGAERAEELMSRTFVNGSPETPVSELAARMRMHVHRRIPIVDQGRLIGIVTRRAALLWLATSQPHAAPECQPAPAAVPIRPPSPPKFLGVSGSGHALIRGADDL